MKAIIRITMLLVLALTSSFSASGENIGRIQLIEALTKYSSFRQITISPDGKHFAAVVTVDDKERLAILNRKKMEVVANMGFRGQESVDKIYWATNERVLVSAAIKLSELDQKVSTGELFALDIDGRGRKQLFGYSIESTNAKIPLNANHEILNIKPSEPDEILMAVYPWSEHGDGAYNYVTTLNIKTGRMTDIIRAPLRGAYFIADANGTLRYAVSHIPGEGMKSFEFNHSEERWVQLSEIENSEQFTPLIFNQKRQALYGTSYGDHNTIGVYLFDPVSKSKSLVYRHEKIDPRTEDLFFSPEGELLWIDVANGKMKTQYIYPDHPLSKLHNDLQAAFEGYLIKFISSTADDRELVFSVHAANDPGLFFIVNTETKKADLLIEPAKHINPEWLAPVEPITLKARDDYELTGFLTRPKNAVGPVPMVVLVHGGPHQEDTEDRWEFSSDVQILASQGYAVLQVNFRGSYGFGFEHRAAGYKQWGRLMQDDVTDATKWAIKQGIADADRIAIYGASYGGYSAMMGLITAPNLYRCGITYVGVSDLALMHEEGDIPERRSGRAYLTRVLGKDEAELKQWSPAHRANDIQAPVLIMHGGKDDRVPIEHAERLEKALKKAGKAVETLYYPHETHGFHKHEHRVEAYTRLLAFLDKHLAKR